MANETVSVTAIPVAPGSGINPKKTKPKTDPYEAAKEARHIVRWMQNHQDAGDPGDYRGYLKHAEVRITRAMDSLTMASGYASERRASPAISEITAALLSLRHAQNYIQAATAGQSPNNEQWKKSVRRLHLLVQSFPTENQMPEGSAENVLRAIVTLLRNIGLEVNEAESDGA